MTRKYRPSNGTEGADFIEQWCGRCQYEAKFRQTQEGEDACPIVASTFLFKVTDPEYPSQWIEDDDFTNARCTAFRQDDGKTAADRAYLKWKQEQESNKQ